VAHSALGIDAFTIVIDTPASIWETCTVMNNPLVGTWRLVSWLNRAEDGLVSHPMGDDAVGYLTYTDDGHMAVTICRANRPPFAGGDLLQATTPERSAAFETYLSYCGRYEWRGESVVHLVELCTFPNWIGTEQVRFAKLSGDRLVLTSPPLLLAGQTQISTLTWARAVAPSL
jgi:hypothetical protein